MLNVNALQKTLSAMPLPELQQYAALHKNDPYVVAMALSIANTKKEAMTAQQGMAGQRPMPKVVDQDIAAIAPQAPTTPLPEETGIGQLPAPNIQGMCGGGIVAFEEGGEVPGYAEGGIPAWVQRLPEGAWLRKLYEKQPGRGFLEPTSMDYRATAPDMAGVIPASTPTGPSPSNAEIEQQYLGMNAPRGLPVNTPLGSAADQGAPAPAAPRAQAASNVPGSNYAVPSANSFMSGIEKLLGPREQVPDQKTIESQLEERQKPYFEKLDKKLAEQKDKLGSDREEAVYMAMIKGGFAAAAGTSPYALANIAKGGEAGIADLSDSFKELRKAAQEQSKMEMELEKSRMEASTGNLKAAWERQDKAQERGQKRDQLLASAYTSITDATIRSNATIAAANAMPANMRTALALGTGDTQKERLESGLAKLNALSAERTDLTFAKMYADHVANAQRTMQEPMSPTAFAATIRSALSAYKPRVVDTDKPTGLMYDRP